MVRRELLIATSTFFTCGLLLQTRTQYLAEAHQVVPARRRMGESLDVTFPATSSRCCEVSKRTKLLFEERRRNFNKLSEQDRRESTRAIAVSSRDDFRHYVHKVLDDIEEAESVGNMRTVTKLTRILAHKDRRTSCNPSKGADGRLITTTAQLLSGWEKFLGAKFQRPTADADRNLENLVAEEDVLGYDELEMCLKALRSGKATGVTTCPLEPTEGPCTLRMNSSAYVA